MSWLKPRRARVDPEALKKKAEESIRDTAEKQEHVNYITAWLNNRKDQNGFGEDVEITFRDRGLRGHPIP